MSRSEARRGLRSPAQAAPKPRSLRCQPPGHTTWLNPYGYLPGELYPFLPFFGALSLAYVALGVIWIVLCLRHCAQLLPLQSCISAVLFLGAVETATWYFDVRRSQRPHGPRLRAMADACLRRAAVRLLQRGRHAWRGPRGAGRAALDGQEDGLAPPRARRLPGLRRGAADPRQRRLQGPRAGPPPPPRTRLRHPGPPRPPPPPPRPALPYFRRPLR